MFRYAEAKSAEQLELKTVVESLEERLGCRVQGKIEIYKVPGNFRFTTLGHNQALLTALMASGHRLDFSHRIKKLQFGEDNEELSYLKRRF